MSVKVRVTMACTCGTTATGWTANPDEWIASFARRHGDHGKPCTPKEAAAIRRKMRKASEVAS